jgi:hypothetical protein
MSTILEMAQDINRVYAAGLQAGQSTLGVDALKRRVRELTAALQGMVEAHEETLSDSEGHYPQPDSGCIECTLGTVPNDRNTGLCAYHKARELLK